MQSQPAESSRGRLVQTARPSARREALSDTSSDEDDDSDDESSTEGDDDEGQAANMDFSEDTHPDSQSNADSVHFARHHGVTTHSHASMKQAHNATLNDDDDAEVEQVSSPETNSAGATLHQSDFDSRPTKAANVGRAQASSSAPLPTSKGRQSDAAVSITDNKIQSKKTFEHDEAEGERKLSKRVTRKDPGDALETHDKQEEMDSDTGDHLFDSPYMPSSPRITSSTNLAGIFARGSGNQGKQQRDDPYTLSWADKDDVQNHSKAEGSLLQSLASSQSRPSWLGKRRTNSHGGAAHGASNSEDELSDPANNGYSYGYGFDEDDDDQKGYLSKATELVGALWNVGSGMVWGRSNSGSSPASTPKSSRKP